MENNRFKTSKRVRLHSLKKGVKFCFNISDRDCFEVFAHCEDGKTETTSGNLKFSGNELVWPLKN